MIDKLQRGTDAEHSSGSREPRVCRLDSESATRTIDAIGSDTSRKILSHLHREPRPPSELAEALDTSIPTVNYHLENLVDADLVEQTDTWYSEKGREMKIYAPVDDPLVFVGAENGVDRVRSLLGRVAGAFALLLVGSVVAQWFVTDTLLALRTPTRLRKAAAAGAVEGVTLTPIPPGLLFFAGGTFVLACTTALWYWTANTGPEPETAD